MARPRVFVSSTYYDLKHVRSSLDIFIDSLGFDSVLSEKGDIAYIHDRPLDESCYREVASADLFVLIVGGRYGAEASSEGKKVPGAFFERYNSITKKEYEAALARDVPVHILIESGVHSEYQTFSRNRDSKSINYAHVESVNVFLLIEEILSQPRNNPVKTFDRFSDIEAWLRDQWAGIFREMLRRQSEQQQLRALTTQIAELKATNETLKKYLEVVMKGVAPGGASDRIIAVEDRRLETMKRESALQQNPWIKHVTSRFSITFDAAVAGIKDANDFEDLADSVGKVSSEPNAKERLLETLRNSEAARRDLNAAVGLLGKEALSFRAKIRRRARMKRKTVRKAKTDAHGRTSGRMRVSKPKQSSK